MQSHSSSCNCAAVMNAARNNFFTSDLFCKQPCTNRHHNHWHIVFAQMVHNTASACATLIIRTFAASSLMRGNLLPARQCRLLNLRSCLRICHLLISCCFRHQMWQGILLNGIRSDTIASMPRHWAGIDQAAQRCHFRFIQLNKKSCASQASQGQETMRSI